MWNLVPWPGMEPEPLQWEWGVSASGLPRKSPKPGLYGNLQIVRFSPLAPSLPLFLSLLMFLGCSFLLCRQTQGWVGSNQRQVGRTSWKDPGRRSWEDGVLCGSIAPCGPTPKPSSIRESRVSPCIWVSRTEIPTQWRKVLSSKYALLFEKMLTHFILHSKQIKAHSSHQGNICKSPVFFPQKSTRKMDAPSIKPHKMFLFLNFKHCSEHVHLFQVKCGLRLGNMSRFKLQIMRLKLRVWKLILFGLHSPLIFISVAYLILTNQEEEMEEQVCCYFHSRGEGTVMQEIGMTWLQPPRLPQGISVSGRRFS